MKQESRKRFSPEFKVESAQLVLDQGYYNTIRPHGFNGGLTPTKAEALYYQNAS